MTDGADFDGETFDRDSDRARLTKQLDRVRALMLDGAWRTLAELASGIGAPEASISARLRDLRKSKFGAFEVDRQHRGASSAGLYEYRLRRPTRCAAQVSQSVDEPMPVKLQLLVPEWHAAAWLADLMTLTDRAAQAGCEIPLGVYELEMYLNERAK